jgi:hypothetical protein
MADFPDPAGGDRRHGCGPHCECGKHRPWSPERRQALRDATRERLQRQQQGRIDPARRIRPER